ncbi:hypothetical protein DPMN_095105 [Dreissena polymorpha]|uniref:Uncharacterized protein n=1 Tax=Dreissena polymorpha TaxID=45954 RepID=A0A9D4L698_DREPO|nr:hypothetical protein DPMN_095105 [Dreissena polymorpha]
MYQEALLEKLCAAFPDFTTKYGVHVVDSPGEEQLKEEDFNKKHGKQNMHV